MIGICIAHGAAADAVARHREGWLKQFSQLIIICPWDDPLPDAIPIGASMRWGRGTLERMLFAAVLASRFPAACVFEYDTVFFQDAWPANFPQHGELINSVVFKNDDEDFLAPTYGHSPWIATGETWWKLITGASSAEGGNPDRWLALAAHNVGVEMRGIAGAFSWDRKWTPNAMIDACDHIIAGAPVVHGIKTRAIYRMLSELAKCR